MVEKKLKFSLLIGLISIFSTLLLWTPFYFRLSSESSVGKNINFQTVMANYDEPLYIVVAKSFYNFSNGNKFEFALPNEYYAAHFPLYPLLIKFGSIFLSYPTSALAVTLICSALSAILFFFIASERTSGDKAFLITILFLFLPARSFVARSVGSPEPLFIFLILLCVWAWTKNNYWVSGIAGAFATLTKSPGILIFVAFFIWILKSKQGTKNLAKLLPMLIIPLTLAALFGIFAIQYGDFWAYFHSGNNIHLQWFPFGVFNASQPWVGTHWLEDIIWIYLVGLIGLLGLIGQKRWEMAFFVGVFLTSIFFVSHRDVSRYALPIMPFVLLSIPESISAKHLKIAICVILVPVFLYSFNFIANNAMQISNWGLLY